MSGTAWQRRDRSSGSARRQAVAAPDETPEQAAYRRLLEHGSACPTCRTRNDAGENAGVACETGERLYEEYRQTRRGPTAQASP